MSVCAQCGKEFSCGMADAAAAGQPCWCSTMPKVPAEALTPGATCRCPACLQAWIASLAQEKATRA
jgi:hypothetical protein